MNGHGVNGKATNGHAGKAPTETKPAEPTVESDDEFDYKWWGKCRLRTVLSEPRRHELTLPDGSTTLTLSTVQMLSPEQLRARALDQAGFIPPLPVKKAAAFLRDVVWPNLFANREVVSAPSEASSEGTLLGDLERCLGSAPHSDDPMDMARGALCDREEGDAMFNARVLYERVRRVCPVPFIPAEFYSALTRLECTNLEVVRVGSWRGRAWLAPASLVSHDVPHDLPKGDENSEETIEREAIQLDLSHE